MCLVLVSAPLPQEPLPGAGAGGAGGEGDCTPSELLVLFWGERAPLVCRDAETLFSSSPPDYPDPDSFCWEKYLEETGASAVPTWAFKVVSQLSLLSELTSGKAWNTQPAQWKAAPLAHHDFQGTGLGLCPWGLGPPELGVGLKAAVPLQRPPHSFLVNMKLEAVDRRNPALVRVASVEDVEDHRIKVALGPLNWGVHRLSGQEFLTALRSRAWQEPDVREAAGCREESSILKVEDPGSRSALVRE